MGQLDQASEVLTLWPLLAVKKSGAFLVGVPSEYVCRLWAYALSFLMKECLSYKHASRNFGRLNTRRIICSVCAWSL